MIATLIIDVLVGTELIEDVGNFGKGVTTLIGDYDNVVKRYFFNSNFCHFLSLGVFR